MKRRIMISGIESGDWRSRGRAERVAINAPIQGGAADVIKIAMARVYHALEHIHVKMILQVHDELVFEAPENEYEHVARELKQIMEQPPIPEFIFHL